MGALDNGPLEDFEVTYGHGINPPFDPSVLLTTEGDVVAQLDPATARKVAHGLLYMADVADEEQRLKVAIHGMIDPTNRTS